MLGVCRLQSRAETSSTGLYVITDGDGDGPPPPEVALLWSDAGPVWLILARQSSHYQALVNWKIELRPVTFYQVVLLCLSWPVWWCSGEVGTEDNKVFFLLRLPPVYMKPRVWRLGERGHTGVSLSLSGVVCGPLVVPVVPVTPARVPAVSPATAANSALA